MQLRYVLKEGFSGFKRAKLSMFAAIFTICVSLLLLSFFAILFLNVNGLVKSLREKVEMEAFLNDQISNDQVTEVPLADHQHIRSVGDRQHRKRRDGRRGHEQLQQ